MPQGATAKRNAARKNAEDKSKAKKLARDTSKNSANNPKGKGGSSAIGLGKKPAKSGSKKK